MAINIIQYLYERKLHKQHEEVLREIEKNTHRIFVNHNNTTFFRDFDPNKPIEYIPTIEPMFTVEYDDIRNELRSMDSGTIERALNELFDHLRKYQEGIKQ